MHINQIAPQQLPLACRVWALYNISHHMGIFITLHRMYTQNHCVKVAHLEGWKQTPPTHTSGTVLIIT